ncbi:MAG: aldehyde dehydrogenase family protein [Candidatus Nanopelagicales bacterium]
MPTTALTFESHSPADGRVIGTFPIMEADAVQETVDRARIAASWWVNLGFDGRRERLLKFKAIVAKRSKELAELVHAENGKPMDDALLEIILSVEHINWAALNAQSVLKRRSVRPGVLTLNQAAHVQYQALGVVGVIGPWNYPVFTPIGSIAYALAAGNAVVFKPSEFTPAVGKWLIDALIEVIPEQPVAQLITGKGATGAALCEAGVDKISFTGSTPTGKKVMAACADSLTPVLLECGGKDAVLVDKDADLNKAADAATFGAFSNAGQTCVGVERVYVHHEVYDEFLALVAEKARALEPGHGPDSSYGPMTMPSQIEVVREHVRDALERGGRAVVGGPESVGEGVVEPIVLAGVPEDSLAVMEETFGPTLVVNPVRDLDEAVDRANAADFGLAASVFSSSRATMERAASQLRVGMVSMNSWVMYAGVSALPWGGVGQSGFGRIHGPDGLREFARSKSTVRERFALPIPLISFARHPRTTEVVRKITSAIHGR